MIRQIDGNQIVAGMGKVYGQPRDLHFTHADVPQVVAAGKGVAAHPGDGGRELDGAQRVDIFECIVGDGAHRQIIDIRRNDQIVGFLLQVDGAAICAGVEAVRVVARDLHIVGVLLIVEGFRARLRAVTVVGEVVGRIGGEQVDEGDGIGDAGGHDVGEGDRFAVVVHPAQIDQAGNAGRRRGDRHAGQNADAVQERRRVIIDALVEFDRHDREGAGDDGQILLRHDVAAFAGFQSLVDGRQVNIAGDLAFSADIPVDGGEIHRRQRKHIPCEDVLGGGELIAGEICDRKKVGTGEVAVENGFILCEREGPVDLSVGLEIAGGVPAEEADVFMLLEGGLRREDGEFLLHLGGFEIGQILCLRRGQEEGDLRSLVGAVGREMEVVLFL